MGRVATVITNCFNEPDCWTFERYVRITAGNVLNTGNVAMLLPPLPRSCTSCQEATSMKCPSSMTKKVGLSISLSRVSTKASATRRFSS